jgi:serine/threonine protein phosphatase PrpC
MQELVNMSAVASDIVGYTAHGASGPRSDDRYFIDETLQLFLVANGTGPTYGGYYAPFGLDPGLDVLIQTYSRDSAPPSDRLRRAFKQAHLVMRELEQTFEKALGGRRGVEAHSDATERVRPPTWAGVRSLCHFYGSVTAVALHKSTICVAQVGDCRAYVGEELSERLLLNDHTLATSIGVAKGFQSPEYLETLALHRLVSTKLLGLSPEATADVVEVPLVRPSRVLLCTPGVWNHDQGPATVKRLLSADTAGFKDVLEQVAADRRTDAAAIRLSLDQHGVED